MAKRGFHLGRLCTGQIICFLHNDLLFRMLASLDKKTFFALAAAFGLIVLVSFGAYVHVERSIEAAGVAGDKPFATALTTALGVGGAALAIVGCLSWLLIVQARKKNAVEQEVHLANDLATRMVESVGDCVCLLDLTGRILSMNSDGLRRREIERLGNVLNSSWLDLWTGESAPRARQAVGQSRGGQVSRFRGGSPIKTGRMKWWDVVVSPICAASGQPEKLLAVSRDISEAYAAEEKFRVLFEGSSDAHLLIERDQLIDCNRAAVLMPYGAT